MIELIYTRTIGVTVGRLHFHIHAIWILLRTFVGVVINNHAAKLGYKLKIYFTLPQIDFHSLLGLCLYHSWVRSVVLWLVGGGAAGAGGAAAAGLAVLERLGGLYDRGLICGHGLCGSGYFVIGVLLTRPQWISHKLLHTILQTNLNIGAIDHLNKLTTLECEQKVFVVLQKARIGAHCILNCLAHFTRLYEFDYLCRIRREHYKEVYRQA